MIILTQLALAENLLLLRVSRSVHIPFPAYRMAGVISVVCSCVCIRVSAKWNSAHHACNDGQIAAPLVTLETKASHRTNQPVTLLALSVLPPSIIGFPHMERIKKSEK